MSSSNGPRPRNRAASASLLLGLLALAVMPSAAAVTGASDDLRLLHAGVSVPLAGILAIATILLARRARRRLERTLGRAGGARTARAGQVVGWLAFYLALIGAIALGVYGLEYFVFG